MPTATLSASSSTAVIEHQDHESKRSRRSGGHFEYGLLGVAAEQRRQVRHLADMVEPEAANTRIDLCEGAVQAGGLNEDVDEARRHTGAERRRGAKPAVPRLGRLHEKAQCPGAREDGSHEIDRHRIAG